MSLDSFKPHKIQGYGYRPDLPDHRDYYYTVPIPMATPPAVDLRPSCPALVYDQGRLGSCTANALAGLFQYNEIVQKKAIQFMPSRLFIYYNERYLENSINEDSGASLRDGIRALCKWGAVDENLWPYHLEQFAAKPPQSVYDAAKTEIITQYSRLVQKISDLRTCLASGHPFVMGIMVYESFESKAVAHSGVVPMPSTSEEAMGGHAVLVVGYNDAEHTFLVRNSWGSGWGQKGYFTIPYEYVLNSDLCGDLWTIQMIP